MSQCRKNVLFLSIVFSLQDQVQRERGRADGVFFGLQDGTSKDKREINCEQKYQSKFFNIALPYISFYLYYSWKQMGGRKI